MRVKMSEFVEDGVTVTDPEDIARLEALRGVPGCIKAWTERATETGRLVSLYAITILRPDQIADLPKAQAEKLIAIGYARAVS